MLISDIATMLKELNIPVAYNHFITTKEPPYTVYKRVSSKNFNADNKSYVKNNIIDIELYTTKKDMAFEILLESILDENELPYEVYEQYIESENVYQVIYEISI